ncbi:MAG: ABC transporter ATP-binding protein [Mycetocola sp.]
MTQASSPEKTTGTVTSQTAEASDVTEAAQTTSQSDAAQKAPKTETVSAPPAVSATEPSSDPSSSDVTAGPAETSVPAGAARGNWFTRLMGVVTRTAPTAVSEALASESTEDNVIVVRGLQKSFGETIAVDGIDLTVRRGTFAGIVGPNGAGKTTTLSMMTGLLRPDSGDVAVNGVAVWDDPERAKRMLGVLPDRLRLFDRLTGAQLIYYAGVLRGVDAATVRARIPELAQAFGIVEAINRPVSDYSVGMAKKVALASAMIHSPRVLVLDEPFESMDPVSTATVVDVLKKYVEHGGTVVLSSHSMDLIARVCDDVAIIVDGDVLAAGTVAEVSAGGSLEERFLALVGGAQTAEGMEWLHTFSD